MSLNTLQWGCAALGAVLVGISKTGVSGLGILAVALFSCVSPSSKHANGLILPLFVVADILAASSYRAHAQWFYVGKVFPWTALGVVLGYVALGRISDGTVRLMVGGIIVALTVLSYWRRRPGAAPSRPLPATAAPVVGVVAGFVTLIANAAGPLMAVYLVAMRLPKMQYVGTTAVFFLLLNLFKVPFGVSLGLIDTESLKFDLLLLPMVLLGILIGRHLLQRLDQTVFENLVLALTGAAGIAMLW